MVQRFHQSQGRKSMSGYPKFRNDRGVPEIRIGVREFDCIGVSPPQDHPHIYIDMGPADTILCPYCGPLSVLRDAVPLRSSVDTARCGSAGQFLC
jgi:uncharacterized Zn-finger protein